MCSSMLNVVFLQWEYTFLSMIKQITFLIVQSLKRNKYFYSDPAGTKLQNFITISMTLQKRVYCYSALCDWDVWIDGKEGNHLPSSLLLRYVSEDKSTTL